MSDSFLLATQIPMTRADFQRWLDSPIPGPGSIADPDAMFDGWFWDGKRAADVWQAPGTTPREFFKGCVAGAAAGSPVSCVLTHEDGALRVYLCDLMGYLESFVHTALLAFAAAGALASDDARHTALFWAETGGNLPGPEWPGWLAVLTVGRGGARFVAEADLTAVIAGLRPAEERFFALVERMAEGEESWDGAGEYRVGAPLEPRFIDPAVLA
ncbi:hypothetical protein AB0H71_25980 [Nocardia sp. NPDC050697]|uniref:hypothetical protein n=1 Tax=Nocardia sp. NPDC050697 TaxID=3155158 RepID=UPI0033E35269